MAKKQEEVTGSGLDGDLFIPDDYDIPSTSSYMKLELGDNKFRALSSVVLGYEYWTSKNKPIRSRTPFTETPDAKIEKDGKIKVSHFWAFVVYNYKSKEIQILEITQKSIMKYIKELVGNPDWGNPKNFDITIKKSGSGFDTEYAIIANPPKPITEDIQEKLAKSTLSPEELFDNNQENF